MADFCNQCAAKLGFPAGDLAYADREPPPPSMGYPALCEGCGPCMVDHEGNCNDPSCLEQHGVKAKAAEILARCKAERDISKVKDIADELCGELYACDITQLHDEITVVVRPKNESIQPG